MDLPLHGIYYLGLNKSWKSSFWRSEISIPVSCKHVIKQEFSRDSDGNKYQFGGLVWKRTKEGPRVSDNNTKTGIKLSDTYCEVNSFREKYQKLTYKLGGQVDIDEFKDGVGSYSSFWGTQPKLTQLYGNHDHGSQITSEIFISIKHLIWINHHSISRSLRTKKANKQ